MHLKDLRVGQPVHGAVAATTSWGFVVDFNRVRGFLPITEVARGVKLGERDEIEGWIVELDPILNWVGLSMYVLPRSGRRRKPLLRVRPDLTPPGRPPVRVGEGVPFHELYMKRRSQRSWAR